MRHATWGDDADGNMPNGPAAKKKGKTSPAGDVAALTATLLTRPKQTPIPTKDFVSTGSTLLNLALTGKPNCGFPCGSYVFLVGDSASGKTWLSMTCLAEAALSKRFDKYAFVLDNAEGGTLMDVAAFFGKRVAARLREPAHGPSATVEEFYYNADTALRQGPCVYVLDSMDALSTEDEGAKFKERKNARGTAREVTGSYGTSKAKANSAGIRQLLPRLHATGSVLIVICQTRDNIGFGSQFRPKTRSGGHALRFYATLEVWSSVRGRVSASVRGKDVQQGIVSRLAVKKNRVTGRERTVEVPILHSTGIDDTGSLVDYLVEWRHWKTVKKEGDADKRGAGNAAIVVPEWGVTLKREALVRHVEERGLETELRAAVTEVWNAVEAECGVARKPRYA